MAAAAQGRRSGGHQSQQPPLQLPLRRATIKKLWLRVPGIPWAQPDDPLYNVEELPEYIPTEGYEGTCPPGATPENYPLDALPKGIPHQPPGLKIQDFYPKADSLGPAPQPIVDYIEEKGLWMSDNEVDGKNTYPHLEPTVQEGDFESSSGGFVDDTLEDDELFTSSLGFNPNTEHEDDTASLL